MTSGGSERQLLTLAARLPRDRFRVEFIVLGPATPQSDEAVALGLTVHVLGTARRGRRGPIPFATAGAGAAGRFVRLVRARRYDVIDAWLYHAYALAALTRPLTRVPVLIAGRRSLSDFKSRFGPLDRILDGLARRSVDLVVANSAAVAADVVAREGLDPGRIRVIHNGVELAPPAEPGWIAEQRAAWAVPPGAVVLGVVANLRPEKGLDVLLAALAEARPALGPVRLVIIGDGPLRTALEADVASRGLAELVHVGGPVADARPLYRAFDVVVQASRSEGLPNAVLEAAAAGRAIVATRAGGTAEIVTDAVSALLVPVDQPAALAAALVRATTDAGLRDRLGLAARETVAARFGVERFVAETAALYEELIVGRGRR